MRFSRRLSSQITLWLVIALAGVSGDVGAASGGSTTTATTRPRLQPTVGVTAVSCEVTPYAAEWPDESFSTTWYGGGELWAALSGGSRGVWYAGPEFTKVLWHRPSGEPLTLAGRRLDDAAPPLEVDIPSGYDAGFQITALTFPAAGCWEVVGRIPGHELRFVVYVHAGSERDTRNPSVPPDWSSLSRPFSPPADQAGTGCPRTPNQTVSRVAGTVLGAGPVHVQGLGDMGMLRLDGAPNTGEVTVPVSWIVDSAYLGPFLIRGRDLDDGRALPFVGESGRVAEWQVEGADHLTTPDWRVVPSLDLQVPGPGCYAVQIDGLDFTETIVFEAVAE